MKVPESIVKKLDELERERKDARNAARRAKRLEKKKADALKKLKEKREVELYYAAENVATWIGSFYGDVECLRLLKALGSIRIFCASYWNGFPVPGCERTTFATISLNSEGKVFYAERYKGMPVHETFLDINPINPMVLVDALHPDYLIALAEHVTSGVVWEYIENNLPKRIY